MWFSIQGNFYCLLVAAKESAKKTMTTTLNAKPLFWPRFGHWTKKKTYLEFGKTLDGLKRSQHPQYPQRFDGANVFSLAAPPTHRPHTQTRKKKDTHAQTYMVRGFRQTCQARSFWFHNGSGRPFLDDICVRVNSERVTASGSKIHSNTCGIAIILRFSLISGCERRSYMLELGGIFTTCYGNNRCHSG